MKRIVILVCGTLAVFIITIVVMIFLGYSPEDTLMKLCVGIPTASVYLYLDKRTKQ